MKISKSVTIVLGMTILVLLTNYVDRVVIYLAPIVVLALWVISEQSKFRIKLSDPFIKYGFVWLTISILSVYPSMVGGYLVRSLSESFFIIGAVVTALLMFNTVKHDKIDLALVVSGAIILIHELVKIVLSGVSVRVNIFNWLILSQSPTEHILTTNIGFISGIVFVFLFVRGRMLYSLIPLVLVFLSGKRIVLAGVIISVIGYLILKQLSESGWKKTISSVTPSVFIVLNVLFVYLLIGFTNGNFDGLIQKYVGINAVQFSMGRQNVYRYLIDSGARTWFPDGLGYTNHVLGNIIGHTLTNVHSDLMKYYFETGIVLSVILLIAYVRLSAGSLKRIALLVYYNALMITDNITIYFDVNMFFYLCLVFVDVGERQSKGLNQTTKYRYQSESTSSS